jgi:hypothetical protein
VNFLEIYRIMNEVFFGSLPCACIAARVFAFLSGPPDYGAGQLDTRRYGEQYSSRGEDADKALLPAQTSYYKDLVSATIVFVCIPPRHVACTLCWNFGI